MHYTALVAQPRSPVYDRNLFLFCFGMFFSVQQNFCFNRKFTPEIEQKQKECVDPVLFILLQICSYNCSGKLGQIGSFCCYFCSSKLRHLSVNRISVSVNFAETSYGRTLPRFQSLVIAEPAAEVRFKIGGQLHIHDKIP